MAPRAHSPSAPADLVRRFEVELDQLTFNCKPLINDLTMLAGNALSANVQAAGRIATILESRIESVEPPVKLLTLYLMDSIVKNVGGAFAIHFSRNLVSMFCGAFEKMSKEQRDAMNKLLGTWPAVFTEETVEQIRSKMKQATFVCFDCFQVLCSDVSWADGLWCQQRRHPREPQVRAAAAANQGAGWKNKYIASECGRRSKRLCFRISESS